MTVLCYHAVDPDWRSPLSVPPALFDEHCQWLYAHEHVVSLTEALARCDTDWRLPQGLHALTFDDGFASLYDHALPTLLRHGLPATVFVVAATLAPAGREVDWVDAPPPWPLKTLTRTQLLEMAASGVQMGSHSWAHHDLTTLSPTACLDDLRRSRETLEDLLSRPVTVLAYPRGRHTRTVRRMARRAGFAHAFALPETRESADPYAIPRTGLYAGDRAWALRLKTANWFDPVRLSPMVKAVRGTLRQVPSRPNPRCVRTSPLERRR